jgi:hypothetical protein
LGACFYQKALTKGGFWGKVLWFILELFSFWDTVMKKIFKFQLEITDRQVIEMQKEARILSLQNQNDTLTLWALVDPEKPKVKRYFQVFGTGHLIQDEIGDYLGTVQTKSNNTDLVWHVFIVPEKTMLPN